MVQYTNAKISQNRAIQKRKAEIQYAVRSCIDL